MRLLLAAALALASLAACAKPPVENFDYYVLSLSWSPQYCAAEARPRDPQCARPYAFVLHGLWPQNERGWPTDCGKGEYLSEALIARMLAIMPSKPLVIHEWRKHGVCSGLTAEAYFDKARAAYESIRIPQRYRLLGEAMTTTIDEIEADFLEANPSLKPSMLTVQCSGKYFRELRVCLTRDLQPRSCGADIDDRCGARVTLRPSR